MQYIFPLLHYTRPVPDCRVQLTQSLLHMFTRRNSPLIHRKHPLSHSCICKTVEMGEKAKHKNLSGAKTANSHPYFPVGATVTPYCHIHHVVRPHSSILPSPNSLQLIMMHGEKTTMLGIQKLYIN